MSFRRCSSSTGGPRDLRHEVAFARSQGGARRPAEPPPRACPLEIPAAWKAAFPVSAYARSLNWENGRLARYMDGPCAAPASVEMSVVPVSPPPAAWKAAFPVSACARRLDWENGRLARSMDGPCAAPATDETSVVPVNPPPALPQECKCG